MLNDEAGKRGIMNWVEMIRFIDNRGTLGQFIASKLLQPGAWIEIMRKGNIIWDEQIDSIG